MPSGWDEKVDFLVVGGGIAGMRAAIELAGAGCTLILTKGAAYEPSTSQAHRLFSGPPNEEGGASPHLYETLRAGDGLCREEAVQALVREAPRQIEQLMEWGLGGGRKASRPFALTESTEGQSRARHLPAELAGHDLLQLLAAKVRSHRAMGFRAHSMVTELLVEDQQVRGVMVLDERAGTFKRILAQGVLLACGGLGQIYSETTNPEVACGDGVALAWSAGARLADLEFIQFHPTVLSVKNAPRLVLPEALRQSGAYLRNIELERFMPRYHEAGELAPWDVVSRSILMEMQKQRSDFVYLDVSGLDSEEVEKRFPDVVGTCNQWNIDITSNLVPVRPAAHFAIGGVATDLDGATTVKGLYAAGETAANGLHGANRLPGNSLLEGLVFGARAAQAMMARRGPALLPPPPPTSSKSAKTHHPRPAPSPEPAHVLDPVAILKETRCLMWQRAGIIRRGAQLDEAVGRLNGLSVAVRGHPDRRFFEARNVLTVARLVAGCAAMRKESRGVHYRSDFPLRNDADLPQHSFVSSNFKLYLSHWASA